MKGGFVMKNHLRKIRKKKKISLEKLAEMTGLNPSTVWRIESNIMTPKISTVNKLAKALKVEINDLFEFQELTK